MTPPGSYDIDMVSMNAVPPSPAATEETLAGPVASGQSPALSETAPPETTAAGTDYVAPPRLVSLDALRGFSMFWILGASAFEGAFHELAHGDKSGHHLPAWLQAVVEFFDVQFQHVKWEGFHFEDLIFPLFVFASGVAIALTIPRKVERHGRRGVAWRTARRAGVLFLLGIWFSGGMSRGFDNIRILGVLQRIAIAYFFAVWLFLYLKPRGLIAVTVGLLVGYWALLAGVAAPGEEHATFAEGHNLTNYLDRMYLPLKKYDGDHDPEGMLSNIPAIASALLGVLVGLSVEKSKASAESKALSVMGAGLALAALGYLFGAECPIIKKLWTPSFVLVAGGWSTFLFGLFYFVIDVQKVRRWSIPFIWIGMNPILLYLLQNVAPAGGMASRLVGGDVYRWFNERLLAGLGDFVLAVVATSISVALAWFLHNRRIFLRF